MSVVEKIRRVAATICGVSVAVWIAGCGEPAANPVSTSPVGSSYTEAGSAQPSALAAPPMEEVSEDAPAADDAASVAEPETAEGGTEE